MNDSEAEIRDRILRFRADNDEPPGTWGAKRVLAGAVRELLDGLSATDAPEPELLRAATEIGAMAHRFAAQPRMADPPGVAEAGLAGMESFHDRSPIVGLANPLAPPLDMTPDFERGCVVGRGVFGRAFEGAPGCVHGGFVAAAFDELLGMATIFSGQPGMTGSLTVSYRSPTPILRELRFVGRFDRSEGRKIHTSGELYDDERLCADATGLFISIDRSKFESLLAERRAREPGARGR